MRKAIFVFLYTVSITFAATADFSTTCRASLGNSVICDTTEHTEHIDLGKVVLMKALIKEIQKEKQWKHYTNKFNEYDMMYRVAMQDAYGLESADEWLYMSSLTQIKTALKSRIMALFDKNVALGRNTMRGWKPLIIGLLKEKEFQKTFVDSTEALKIVNKERPEAILTYMNSFRTVNKIPYAANDPRIKQRTAPKTPEEKQKKIEEYESLAKKYGYK